MKCSKNWRLNLSKYLIQLLKTIKHNLIVSVFGFSSTCYQKPSCSQYCFQQIQEHGLFTGGIKGLRRIIKCH